ncbi:DUF2877 domain-containing protein [Facklamia miroungae]|uniref:DUF2877 domain-containing protein n=1 Tax=Facklamia miroungae TaxID=120956 RepID=A0A1G7V0D4_9LACT|nr:DUF2877 domain-containing protein [Facklamia miroungae]NKZ30215.1 DUF2877 domain-containing protein [Facklamia miroungae]SDG53008.1 Protein of unknown function [Facklamia miroungae]
MNKTVRDKTSLILSSYLSPLEDQTYWVDSVFDHGINLISKKTDGPHQLIYLSGVNQLKASVLGIQIENKSLFDQMMQKLKPGEQIRQCKDTWCLYTRPIPFEIKLIDYQQYSCLLPDYSLNLTVDFLQDMIDLLEQAQIYEQSAFNQLPALKHYYQNLLTESFQSQVVNHSNGMVELVQFLFGKGLGLTPSGDDFLQGMLVLEQVTLFNQNRLPQFNQSFGRLPDLVKQQMQITTTTKVSQAYYHALFDRQVNPVWLKFIKAIKEHSPEQLIQSIRLIQTYGHTSGNDMLLGAQFYLQIIKKSLKGEV